MQLCFFKRLLALVYGIPNAELRLELNISSIKLKVLKSSLNCVSKILDMKEHCLSKLCFLRSLQLSRVQSVDIKYNWVVQLKDLLELDQTPWTLWTNLSSAYWKAKIPGILKNAESNLKLTDLNSFLDKHSCQIPLWSGPYRTSASYLRNSPLYLSRTFAQLRLANEHYVALSCNRNRAYIDATVLCTICNLNESEDLAHTVLRCPIYQPYKDHFLVPLLDAYNNNPSCTPRNLFDDFKPMTLSAIFMLLSRSLKLRAFCQGHWHAVSILSLHMIKNI